MATLFDGTQSSIPETVTATFCATLVDEWVRAGVTEAMVAPGSRSTPMALALMANSSILVHMHHDERSAAFMALGYGLATGRPALVLTTSGTATVELHPAVVEAHQARVPMICITADRPPELHHFGAPQTVDQTHLYGRSTRFFVDPGAPHIEGAASWRALASRCVLAATGRPPGPVQINLPFRDPLVGRPGSLPPGRVNGAPWLSHASTPNATVNIPSLEELFSQLGVPNNAKLTRGLIVAGASSGGDGLDPQAIHGLAGHLGWPVLAEPRSGCRTPESTTVAYGDMLLRNPDFAAANIPEVIVQFGQPPASKFVNEWLAAAAVPWVLVDPDGWFFDPARRASVLLGADPSEVARTWDEEVSEHALASNGWLKGWSVADKAAEAVIEATLGRQSELTEPAIAKTVMAVLPEESALLVASSMPIRDVEWYSSPRYGIRVLSNRGANGIDGVTSSAVGVALSGVPTALLIGDVAFLHDTNALIGLPKRSVHLVLVVVDNDGGGIFSFLPQGQQINETAFETLFGTPHGTDLAALAKAHHLQVTTVQSVAHLGERVGEAFNQPGVHIIVARTNRLTNVALHDEIHRSWEL